MSLAFFFFFFSQKLFSLNIKMTFAQSGIMEKENSEFKPVKLRLKIDFVSYPARYILQTN